MQKQSLQICVSAMYDQKFLMVKSDDSKIRSFRSVMSPAIISGTLFKCRYLHASSFPKGSFVLLKASTPANLTAVSLLLHEVVDGLLLIEKKSLTQTEADLSTFSDFSAFS